VGLPPLEEVIKMTKILANTWQTTGVPMFGEDPSGDPQVPLLDANKVLKAVLQASTAIIGTVAIDQTTPGTTDHVTGNIEAWGGTPVTGADITAYFANLDLSLSAVLAALQGAGSKDLSTVETAIDAVTTAVASLQTGAETLQDIIDAITGLQAASETLQSVIDEVELLRGASDKDFTTLETAVGTLQATILGSGSKDLTTLQTSLDAIKGALKSVDTDELVTRVTDSAGTEINPAKEDGNLAAIKTALEVIDDWDDTDRAKVNLIVGQAGVAAGAGAADALTQRVTLASDDPAVVDLAAIEVLNTAIKNAVETIDNFISGSRGLVTEDSAADIKTAVEAINTALQSTGVTQVQLDAIKTAVELIDNAIAGTEMQVDIVTSALPTGAATEATLASIKTAVELIDNFISGSKGLVTEDNSASIKTATESLVTQMGEVQASPTANTVLARLKDLLTGIVLAAGSNIIGQVSIDQTTPGTTNGVQVNAALPSGTNAIGKLAANSGVDIGDVNVRADKTIESELKAITEVSAGSQSKSSELDVSGQEGQVTLFIDHAKDAAGAAVGQGTEYVIQASQKASGNDTWRAIASFTAEITAPTAVTTDGEETAGATDIECGASVPAVGDIIFFKNATLANSEWANVIAVDATGGSEYFTLEDGLTNTQAAGTYYTQGEQFVVTIDIHSITRLRVVCNNTKGTTNQAVVWRCAAITQE